MVWASTFWRRNSSRCSTCEELDEPEVEKERLKIAVLGKPNTGKSTLTNALSGKDVSIVSDIPGRPEMS